MIKNEREFKISKSQVVRFREALDTLSTSSVDSEQGALAVEIQVEAMKSQLEELVAQVSAYEQLVTAPPKVISVDSLEGLPVALIQARIASGLTQKGLAEKLGLKEQQIQRYEATNYSGANLQRLVEISDALGVRVKPLVTLQTSKLSNILRKLADFGIDREFVWHRLLPRSCAEETEGGKTSIDESSIVHILDSRLRRIFGWSISSLLEATEPNWNESAIANVRFKKGTKKQSRTTTACTVYAHHICLLALNATKTLKIQALPDDPRDLHDQLLGAFGRIGFEEAVRHLWNCGVPVIPLNVPGDFHGAVWRVKGRNAIVLNQKIRQDGRWLIDLLHEACHTTEEPNAATFSKIDVADPLVARDTDENEARATRYALFASLGRSFESLVQESVAAAQGKVEVLKRVVPEVARRHNVHSGVLANVLAYRLGRNSPPVNWWPTAMSLQKGGPDPFDTARQLFFSNVDRNALTATDWEILTGSFEELL
jgi:transcriptional regulator with XRE-family HTH domain